MILSALLSLSSLCLSPPSDPYELDGFSLLYRFDGTQQAERLGKLMRFMGDVNHDGYDDLLFSSEVGVPGVVGAGSVYVVSGFDGRLLWRALGTQVKGYLGADGSGLCSIADASGDGCRDVLAFEE